MQSGAQDVITSVRHAPPGSELPLTSGNDQTIESLSGFADTNANVVNDLQLVPSPMLARLDPSPEIDRD